jgi:hypothetical protein
VIDDKAVSQQSSLEGQGEALQRSGIGEAPGIEKKERLMVIQA